MRKAQVGKDKTEMRPEKPKGWVITQPFHKSRTKLAWLVALWPPQLSPDAAPQTYASVTHGNCVFASRTTCIP
jgi:hypothetical protein